MSIGKRIKARREEINMTQVELAERLGITKQLLYKYESEKVIAIPQDRISQIARVLETTPSYLFGWEDNLSSYEHVYMIPIYDSAAAGFNVLAQDTIVGYSPADLTSPSEADLYMYVTVVGDSMAPLIDDGSKILVKKQESVDSGQIAVVLIDGEEAVVKRVFYGSGWIELQSANPYYPPRRFEGADAQRIRVLGLVKEVIKVLA